MARARVKNIGFVLPAVAASAVLAWRLAENFSTTAGVVPEAAVVVLNGAGRADVCESLAVNIGAELADGVDGYRNADGRLGYSVRETLIRRDRRYGGQAVGYGKS